MTPDGALDTALTGAAGFAAYGPIGIFLLISLAVNVVLFRLLMKAQTDRFTDLATVNKDVTGGMFASTAAMSGLAAGVTQLRETVTKFGDQLDRMETRK